MSEGLQPRIVAFDEAEKIAPFGTPARIMLRSEDTGGAFSALLVLHEPDGGPPPHKHAHQAEYFFVVEGEYEMTIAGKTQIIGPGTIAFVPPDTVHSFRNISGKTAKMLDWSLPGGQDEYFREIDAMGRGGKGFDAEMMERLADTNRRHDVTFVE